MGRRIDEWKNQCLSPFSCSHKLPWTWQLKQQNVFLIVLGASQPRVWGVWLISWLVRTHLVCRQRSRWSSHGGEQKEVSSPRVSSSFFLRALILSPPPS